MTRKHRQIWQVARHARLSRLSRSFRPHRATLLRKRTATTGLLEQRLLFRRTVVETVIKAVVRTVVWHRHSSSSGGTGFHACLRCGTSRRLRQGDGGPQAQADTPDSGARTRGVGGDIRPCRRIDRFSMTCWLDRRPAPAISIRRYLFGGLAPFRRGSCATHSRSRCALAPAPGTAGLRASLLCWLPPQLGRAHGANAAAAEVGVAPRVGKHAPAALLQDAIVKLARTQGWHGHTVGGAWCGGHVRGSTTANCAGGGRGALGAGSEGDGQPDQPRRGTARRLVCTGSYRRRASGSYGSRPTARAVSGTMGSPAGFRRCSARAHRSECDPHHNSTRRPPRDAWDRTSGFLGDDLCSAIHSSKHQVPSMMFSTAERPPARALRFSHATVTYTMVDRWSLGSPRGRRHGDRLGIAAAPRQ